MRLPLFTIAILLLYVVPARCDQAPHAEGVSERANPTAIVSAQRALVAALRNPSPSDDSIVGLFRDYVRTANISEQQLLRLDQRIANLGDLTQVPDFLWDDFALGAPHFLSPSPNQPLVLSKEEGKRVATLWTHLRRASGITDEKAAQPPKPPAATPAEVDYRTVPKAKLAADWYSNVRKLRAHDESAKQLTNALLNEPRLSKVAEIPSTYTGEQFRNEIRKRLNALPFPEARRALSHLNQMESISAGKTKREIEFERDRMAAELFPSTDARGFVPAHDIIHGVSRHLAMPRQTFSNALQSTDAQGLSDLETHLTKALQANPHDQDLLSKRGQVRSWRKITSAPTLVDGYARLFQQDQADGGLRLYNSIYDLTQDKFGVERLRELTTQLRERVKHEISSGVSNPLFRDTLHFIEHSPVAGGQYIREFSDSEIKDRYHLARQRVDQAQDEAYRSTGAEAIDRYLRARSAGEQNNEGGLYEASLNVWENRLLTLNPWCSEFEFNVSHEAWESKHRKINFQDPERSRFIQSDKSAQEKFKSSVFYLRYADLAESEEKQRAFERFAMEVPREALSCYLNYYLSEEKKKARKLGYEGSAKTLNDIAKAEALLRGMQHRDAEFRVAKEWLPLLRVPQVLRSNLRGKTPSELALLNRVLSAESQVAEKLATDHGVRPEEREAQRQIFLQAQGEIISELIRQRDLARPHNAPIISPWVLLAGGQVVADQQLTALINTFPANKRWELLNWLQSEKEIVSALLSSAHDPRNELARTLFDRSLALVWKENMKKAQADYAIRQNERGWDLTEAFLDEFNLDPKYGDKLLQGALDQVSPDLSAKITDPKRREALLIRDQVIGPSIGGRFLVHTVADHTKAVGEALTKLGTLTERAQQLREKWAAAGYGGYYTRLHGRASLGPNEKNPAETEIEGALTEVSIMINALKRLGIPAAQQDQLDELHRKILSQDTKLIDEGLKNTNKLLAKAAVFSAVALVAAPAAPFIGSVGTGAAGSLTLAGAVATAGKLAVGGLVVGALTDTAMQSAEMIDGNSDQFDVGRMARSAGVAGVAAPLVMIPGVGFFAGAGFFADKSVEAVDKISSGEYAQAMVNIGLAGLAGQSTYNGLKSPTLSRPVFWSRSSPPDAGHSSATAAAGPGGPRPPPSGNGPSHPAPRTSDPNWYSRYLSRMNGENGTAADIPPPTSAPTTSGNQPVAQAGYTTSNSKSNGGTGTLEAEPIVRVNRIAKWKEVQPASVPRGTFPFRGVTKPLHLKPNPAARPPIEVPPPATSPEIVSPGLVGPLSGLVATLSKSTGDTFKRIVPYFKTVHPTGDWDALGIPKQKHGEAGDIDPPEIGIERPVQKLPELTEAERIQVEKLLRLLEVGPDQLDQILKRVLTELTKIKQSGGAIFETGGFLNHTTADRLFDQLDPVVGTRVRLEIVAALVDPVEVLVRPRSRNEVGLGAIRRQHYSQIPLDTVKDLIAEADASKGVVRAKLENTLDGIASLIGFQRAGLKAVIEQMTSDHSDVGLGSKTIPELERTLWERLPTTIYAFVERNAGWNPERENTNPAFKKLALTEPGSPSWPIEKTTFFHVENAVLKLLNEWVFDPNKELSKAVIGLYTRVFWEELANTTYVDASGRTQRLIDVILKVPGNSPNKLLQAFYKDYKSLRIGFADASPALEKALIAMSARVAETFRDELLKHKNLRHWEVLDESGRRKFVGLLADPRTWYAMGTGPTPDLASLNSKINRKHVSKTDPRLFSPKAHSEMSEEQTALFRDYERRRDGLMKEHPGLFENGVLKESVTAALNKATGPGKDKVIKAAVLARTGIELSSRQINDLVNMFQNLGTLSPSIYVDVETHVDMRKARHGLVAFDMVGQGVRNNLEAQRRLVDASAEAKNLPEEQRIGRIIWRLREGQTAASAEFEKLQSTVRHSLSASGLKGIKASGVDGVAFSGDDGAFFPDQELSEQQRRAVVAQFGSAEVPSRFRVTFIPRSYANGEPIPGEQYEGLVNTGEHIEKALRAAILSKPELGIGYDRLREIAFAMDVRPAAKDDGGSVDVIAGTASTKPLTQTERQIIENTMQGILGNGINNQYLNFKFGRLK